MKLLIDVVDDPILISKTKVSVLEIENPALFARIGESLLSEEGQEADIPYTIWKDEKELKPSSIFFPIHNPLELPWDHRLLAGKLGEMIWGEINGGVGGKLLLEEVDARLRSCVMESALSLCADYHFALEWDVKKYLKSFGFSIDLDQCDSILDKLILFTDFASDVGVDRVFLFFNLKKYLTRSEIAALYDRFLLRGTLVFDLESGVDNEVYDQEEKIRIHQDFLQYCSHENQSRILSLSSGEFAPTVLVQ